MEPKVDIEAEQRVLSCILCSESACSKVLTENDESDFYRPFHQSILSLVRTLYKRGLKPTSVEVIKEGYTVGIIKSQEDVESLRYIAEQYIDDENIGYWQDRVKKAAKTRKAQKILLHYTRELEDERNFDVDQFIKRAGSEFMTLAMDAETEQIKTGADLAEFGKKQAAANVEKWRRMQEDAKTMGEIPLEGVPTGFKKLDELTMGYKPGDLIILGAQTGHGKTAFALNTVNAVTVDGCKPLFYVNTEMSEKQVAYRMGAILSQIESQRIRNGSLTNGELYQVNTGYDVLAYSAFHYINIPNLTPNKLHALAQKAKLRFNTELLILDYVGRMEKRDLNLQEWQMLEDIVKSCKIMAQNLEIAVMVLVQLNPDGTLQGAKRMKNECDIMLNLLPMCENLKDEQELAEAQRKYQQKYKKNYEPFNYRLWVGKSRDSDSGMSIPLVFDMERQQMRQATLGSPPADYSDIGREVKGKEKRSYGR